MTTPDDLKLSEHVDQCLDLVYGILAALEGSDAIHALVALKAASILIWHGGACLQGGSEEDKREVLEHIDRVANRWSTLLNKIMEEDHAEKDSSSGEEGSAGNSGGLPC